MLRLGRWRIINLVLLLFSVISITALGQSFDTLLVFDGNNGETPYFGPLIQGRDGNLYGMTTDNDLPDGGALFSMTPEGSLTRIYVFCTQDNECTDGEYPTSLIQASDGSFYGTTQLGGKYKCGPQGCGTVFRITPKGELRVLHNFSWGDGAFPGGLFQARDGSFYGATADGGLYTDGTIFRISRHGFETLYNFCALPRCADGNGPGGVIQAANGNFYGTTSGGGAYGSGTIFRITPGGKLTTLHSFNGVDGFEPMAPLVEGPDGNFYGATYLGGSSNNCAFGCGTVFRMTPSGTVTTLVSFDSTNGTEPRGLLQATDKNLYGTTYQGGSGACDGGCGTVFRVSTGGKLTVLHSFSGPHGDDGAFPYPLLQSTNGTFYGTTYAGPANNFGTVFNVKMGLHPFVAFVRDSGKVGQTGGILGQGFNGTTNVSINGIPATFTVVSDTFLKATVPVGATTGFVTVTTPSGVLTSNKPFRVIP